MDLPSYRDHGYWRRYQRFFPEDLRIDDATAPAETYWRWRGADLHLDRTEPDRPRFRAILLHGGGGNGRLLAPIGRMLSRAGGACVAPDLPGYGLSKVPDALFDYAAWLDATVDLAAAEHARSKNPLPLVFFGLSLGGMLAYQAAAASRVPVAGVIATTLCDPRYPEVREAFASFPLFGRAAPSLLRAGAAIAGRVRVPIRWVSRMDRVSNDPELAALISADALGGGIDTPVSFLRSLMEMVPPVEPERFSRCPVLLAHPGADRWTPLSASRPFFDRIAGPKELVVLENCGHIPIEDPGRTRLGEAVHAFLETVVQTRAS